MPAGPSVSGAVERMPPPDHAVISICSPHSLLTLPPFVMVSTDVSWLGMSR